jgi:hypothetical protein
MDIRMAPPARLSALSAVWRRDRRERRSRDEGKRRADLHAFMLNAAGDDLPPFGPSAAFMAHVLGQSARGNANPSGAIIYRNLRQPRLACGVCADERV